jgi:hypothetical protein
VGSSLQDQLLKAGLVDKNKASKARKQNRTQARQQRNSKSTVTTEVDQQRQREQAEKAARDRELNRQRNEAHRQREIAAQVKQLVNNNRLPRSDSEDDRPFYFQNKGKLKQMYVSPQTHKMITSGQLAIVNHNGVFELVPSDIAEKIRERNPSLVIDLPKEQPADENDPYAQYQVPDDLMW